MRVLIQRVRQASVKVDEKITGEIKQGFLLLVGFENADTDEDLTWTANKISALRIFDDENGVMNKSILEVDGEILCVSQFTLFAMTKKGNRPSYIKAAKPDISIPIYKAFIKSLEEAMGKKIATGIFGADMKVSLTNDGPVTILIDTKNKE